LTALNMTEWRNRYRTRKTVLNKKKPRILTKQWNGLTRTIKQSETRPFLISVYTRQRPIDSLTYIFSTRVRNEGIDVFKSELQIKISIECAKTDRSMVLIHVKEEIRSRNKLEQLCFRLSGTYFQIKKEWFSGGCI